MKQSTRPSPPHTKLWQHLRLLQAQMQSVTQVVVQAVVSGSLVLLVSLILLAAVSSGCSPGTGGTGTGPIISNMPDPTPGMPAGTPPTATPTSPPTTSTTSTGSLPSVSTTTAPATTTGTATPTITPAGNESSASYTSSGTGTGTVTAQLQPDSVTISAGCGTFNYAGSWALATDGSVTLQGEFVSLSASSGQPRQQAATAVLRFLAGGNTISVVVTNARSDVLIAPTELTRITGLVVVHLGSGC